MSVYTLESTEINLILNKLYDLSDYNHYQIKTGKHTFNFCHADYTYTFDEIGQILVDANYKSLNERYEEQNKVPVFKFKRYLAEESFCEILELIRSYIYNSSEHMNFENSIAYKIITNIHFTIINQLLSDNLINC